jgi:hypothetical protein
MQTTPDAAAGPSKFEALEIKVPSPSRGGESSVEPALQASPVVPPTDAPDHSTDADGSPMSPRSLLTRARRASSELLSRMPSFSSVQLPEIPMSPRTRLRHTIWRVMEANAVVSPSANPDTPRRRRLRNSVQLVRENAAVLQARFRENAEATQALLRANAEAAQAKLREQRAISVAQYYLLTAATLLLLVAVVGQLIVTALKLLARIEVVWWLTRSANLDDFRKWAQETCSEAWNGETILCQAVDGSWLARELIRAKLSEAHADHCDPETTAGGCRHLPCQTKGLSRVLLGLADSWSSPLNNRFSTIFYALLPIRTRLQVALTIPSHRPSSPNHRPSHPARCPRSARGCR